MKATNVIIGIVAFMMLCVPFILTDGADASNDATLKVSTAEAYAGDDVKISVSLETNPGIWSITANVEYDSALTIKSIDCKTSELNLTKGVLTKNPYKIYMDRSDLVDSTSAGPIVEITFTVSDTAEPGDYAVKLLKDADFLVINSAGNEVPTTLVEGCVTVKPVPTYTMFFVDQLADAPTDAAYVEGATFNLPSHGDVTGYDFLGWNDGNDLYQPGGIYTVGASDVTFTAVYDAIEYTVRFLNHNGSVLQEKQSEYGSIITYGGSTPVKEPTAQYSYSFSGWEGFTEGMKVSGNHIFTAKFNESVRSYDVVFKNGGSVVKSETLTYGSVITAPSQDPVKASTVDKVFTFSKWNGYTAGMTVTGDVTFTAEFTESARTYTVVFKNGDQVLQTGSVAYGTVPAYTGAKPVKAADAQYTYIFSKWTPVIVAVTGDATYEAVFDWTVNEYEVKWMNGTTVFKTDVLAYGATITAPAQNPVKASTVDKVFTFSKWNGFSSGMKVSDDVTFTAEFTESARPYTVVFKNGDQVLQTLSVEYGKTPAYTGAKPVKAADAQYTYIFSKWTPVIVAVTGDATYEAVFDRTVNEYEVKWMNGNTVVKSEVLEYGTILTAPSQVPVKDQTVDKVFTFSKWNGYTAGMTVTGDATFTAEFTESARMYKVTFMNGGEVFQTSEQAYGSKLKIPVSNPVKASDAVNNYVFQKWTGYTEGMNVSGEHTFTAEFRSVGIVYTVTYMSEGKLFAEQQYGSGDVIVLPGTNPVKESTVDKVFVFSKWNGYTAGMTVTGDVTFTAEFTESARPYTVVFKNGDQVLQTLSVEYGKTPAYTGAKPVKAADAQYTYIFSKWTPAIVAVTGDATYEAVFDRTVNEYEVKWMNGNTVVTTEVLAYGASITAPSQNPVKDETVDKVFTFSKWNGYTAGMTVTGDATFTAEFTESARMYKVTFMSGGEVFQTSEQAYGSELKVPASNPVKESDQENSYVFSKWNGYTAGMTVTGDATFTAEFRSVEIIYTVTYKVDGKVFAKQQYGSGDVIVLPGTNPVKEPTVDKVFAFSKWNGYTAGMTVTGDVSFTAKFTYSARMYTVTFMAGDDVFRTYTLAYGSEIVAPSENPVLEGSEFTGWNGYAAGMTVTGDVTFTAIFGELPTFKVFFKVGDVVHAEMEVKVGFQIPVPENPVRKGFTFEGWNSAVPGVMPSNDLVFVAKMVPVPEKEKHEIVTDILDDPHSSVIEDAQEGEIISVKPSNGKLEVKDVVVDVMADAGVEMEVVVDDIYVRYSNGVLDGLKGSKVDISIRTNPVDMNDKQREVVDDRFSLSLELSSGGSKVSDLNGKATINFTYVLRDGQTASNVTVFCVNDDGSVVKKNTWYDSTTSNLYFDTDTHSVYFVGESQPSSGGMDMTMVLVGVVAVVAVIAVAAVFFMRSRN